MSAKMKPGYAVSELTQKHCKACSGEADRLSDERAEQLLREIPYWKREGKQISRIFRFKNYYETIAFVNASAWVSHREDHHPDLEVGYNRCQVRFSTHSVGGLSENDFICAAKLERCWQFDSARNDARRLIDPEQHGFPRKNLAI